MPRLAITTLLVCAAALSPLGAESAGGQKPLTGRDIKDGTVTSRDIRDGGLGSREFHTSVEGPAGRTGAVGPVGPTGSAGADGTAGYEVVLKAPSGFAVPPQSTSSFMIGCGVGRTALGGNAWFEARGLEVANSRAVAGGRSWALELRNFSDSTIAGFAYAWCTT